MTREVKSRLIIEWEIRSQAPYFYGVQFIDYMLVGASLRYSQIPLEKVQKTIYFIIKVFVK